jgi:hypothetical protein
LTTDEHGLTRKKRKLNCQEAFKISSRWETIIVSGDSFWTALAERSGDSAFCEIYRFVGTFPKRRRAPLAAAVQNYPF